MNKIIMTAAGFSKEVKKLFEDGRCPFCGIAKKEMKFRDELSIKENQISGICQQCQDDIFGW